MKTPRAELLNPDDIITNKPKDHSNLIMAITLAVLVTFCGTVLYVVSLLERLMY